MSTYQTQLGQITDFAGTYGILTAKPMIFNTLGFPNTAKPEQAKY